MADETASVVVPGWVVAKLGDWPKEQGFPEPTARKRGRGNQLVYELDSAQTKAFHEQVKTLGAAYAKWSEKQAA